VVFKFLFFRVVRGSVGNPSEWLILFRVIRVFRGGRNWIGFYVDFFRMIISLRPDEF
jgi:hypothetical protein